MAVRRLDGGSCEGMEGCCVGMTVGLWTGTDVQEGSRTSLIPLIDQANKEGGRYRKVRDPLRCFAP